jgi:hypothetical protein
MKSKKILVPIDIDNPEKIISGILYPKISNNKPSLLEVKNGKEWKYGMVVYKGGGITENDLFAKIVDAKTKIASVKQLLNSLVIYLEKINDFSIGNIVYIEHSDDDIGFTLKKYANRPIMKRNNRLP